MTSRNAKTRAIGSLAWRPLLFVFLVGVAAVIAVHASGIEPADVAAHLEAMGPWAPLVFIGALVVGTLFFVPATIFTIAAGLLFGPVYGILFGWIGLNLGAAIGYGIGRAGGGPVKPFLDRKAGRVMRIMHAHGVGSVISLRMVPFLPFSVLNYSFGLALLRPRDYFIGTAIGVVPILVAYVFVGASVGAIDRDDPLSLQFILYLLSASVLILVLSWFAGRSVESRGAGSASEAGSEDELPASEATGTGERS